MRTWQEFVEGKQLTEEDRREASARKAKRLTAIKHGSTAATTQGQSVRPFTEPDPDAEAKVGGARIHNDKRAANIR